jgi:hypothetical protein
MSISCLKKIENVLFLQISFLLMRFLYFYWFLLKIEFDFDMEIAGDFYAF